MVMASITIRNLDVDMKTGIRKRAAGNGRSMEEEVRVILRAALGRENVPDKGPGTAIHERFKPFGGVELELPARPATSPRGRCRTPSVRVRARRAEPRRWGAPGGELRGACARLAGPGQ